jgi:prepilin-type N-terminal cleavage/methylation domain-containing protein
MLMKRLRSEAGFSMAELLVVLIIAGIVLAGVASLMQVVMRQSTGTVLRTEATQRGRLVLDQITQQLRSQVCLDVDTATEKVSLAAASDNSVTFYTDLSDGSKQPVKRTVTYDPVGKTIKQTSYLATSAIGVVPTTFSATGTTRTLLDNVDAPTAGMFAFWGYQPTGTPRPLTRGLGPGSLSATDLGDTAQINIVMQVRPPRSKDPKLFTQLEDSVHLRTADPNQNNPDPDCR